MSRSCTVQPIVGALGDARNTIGSDRYLDLTVETDVRSTCEAVKVTFGTSLKDYPTACR